LHDPEEAIPVKPGNHRGVPVERRDWFLITELTVPVVWGRGGAGFQVSRIFKKCTGLSPLEYRRTFSRIAAVQLPP
jgi:hypothetical protein